MRYFWVAAFTICLSIACLAENPATPPSTNPAGTTQPTSKPDIIYLIDGSGSMVGGKDSLESDGLKKAVDALKPTDFFDAIIFHENKPGQPIFHFEKIFPSLVPANDSNKAALHDYVDKKLEFYGLSDPIPALEEAFADKPQLIYLVSDGDFDDCNVVLAKVKELNADRSVKIRTILVMGRPPKDDRDELIIATMSKIAKENGGTSLAIYDR
jgi:hypothetical protein